METYPSQSAVMDDIDEPAAQQVVRKRRPRHFPHAAKLVFASLLRVSAWASLAAFAWCCVKMAVTNDRMFGYYGLGLIAFFLAVQLAAFVISRSLACPLCHCSVLHSKSCRKHQRARNYFFLGHLVSVVLDVLVRSNFCCMYCGTEFRLKK